MPNNQFQPEEHDKNYRNIDEELITPIHDDYENTSFEFADREYRNIEDISDELSVEKPREDIINDKKVTTSTKTKKKLKFIYVISTVSIFLLLAVYMLVDDPEIVEKIKVNIFGK